MRSIKAFVLFFVPCVLLLAQSGYVETGSKIWDMETQFVRSQRIMVEKETISIENISDKDIVIGLSVQTTDGLTADDSPGQDTYVLNARITKDREPPEFDEYLDIVNEDMRWASDKRKKRFGKGIIKAGETQFLWLKMFMPTSSEVGYGEKALPLVLTIRDKETDEILETIELSIVLTFSPTPNQEVYRIKSGWNLLSWPYNESLVAADVFGSYTPPLDGLIYPYNAEETSYSKVEVLSPGRGFCLFSDRDIDIPMKGTKYSSNLTIELAEGWNLIGGPFMTVGTEILEQYPAVKLPVYEYRMDSGDYKETSIMNPGFGYWVLALENTEISLQ